MVSFIRSTSILFQGVWLILMGYMLWTPGLIPKGCFLHLEDGHQVVRCTSHEALHRAKSLVNLQFSWFLVVISVFAVTFYLILGKFYKEKDEYSTLRKEEDEDSDDVEFQKGLVNLGKGFSTIDMER